jgi:hypothetical protein
MSSVSMDNAKVRRLMSTVDLIAATLDANPDSWRDQLQAIRNITQSLELLDLQPDESRKQWQLPLIEVFQQVAYADADNGGVPDIGNWCLRQAVTLLQVYPGDVDLLTSKNLLMSGDASNMSIVIGRNWLHRAQKPLSHIHNTERDSNSSGGSPGQPLSRSEEELRDARAAREAEDRLHTGEYVEARGILLPATEYLKRAVDAATTQDKLAGPLLATVSPTSYHSPQ